MSLWPGTRLGPYEIVALIGAGGRGEMYAGRSSSFQETIRGISIWKVALAPIKAMQTRRPPGRLVNVAVWTLNDGADRQRVP
jgi:hypothetical protein